MRVAPTKKKTEYMRKSVYYGFQFVDYMKNVKLSYPTESVNP